MSYKHYFGRTTNKKIRLTAVPDLLMFSDWLLVIMCRNNRNPSAISSEISFRMYGNGRVVTIGAGNVKCVDR